SGAEGGLIDYAESEALLRSDELDAALALAAQASSSLDGDLAARAHLVAGRSAHLADRWQVAEGHAQSAAALALAAPTREDALWFRFVASWESQRPDLRQRLEDFEAAARPGVRQALLSAVGAIGFAGIQGGMSSALDAARGALAIAKEEEEPIAHTSLLCAY